MLLTPFPRRGKLGGKIGENGDQKLAKMGENGENWGKLGKIKTAKEESALIQKLQLPTPTHLPFFLSNSVIRDRLTSNCTLSSFKFRDIILQQD